MHQASMCEFQVDSNLGWKTLRRIRNIEDLCGGKNENGLIDSMCFNEKFGQVQEFSNFSGVRIFFDGDCLKLLLESTHYGVYMV